MRYTESSLAAAKALAATNGWSTVQEAYWDLTDDRSHGDDGMAEAATAVYGECPIAIRTSKVESLVAVYVARVLDSAKVLDENE